MIAAIWSANGAADVARRCARIAESFGRPELDDRRTNGGIFGWNFARPARPLPFGGVVLGTLHRARTSVGPRGFDGGESLHGNFALAGWHTSGGIFLARGPLGGEPLYWCRDGAAWVAASRLEALLAALDASPAFDIMHLATFAAGMVDAGEGVRATPYAGVERFLSCERRVFPPTAGADSRPFIWTNIHSCDAFDDDAEHLAVELWRAVCASVGRAMSGARTVGVLTGGGVDSSGLLGAAVEVGRDLGITVVPVSVDFAGPGDDRPHRRALEQAFGIEALIVAPEEAAPFVTSSLCTAGAPSLYPSLALIHAAARVARARGVERILTGFLGDLVLDAPPGALLHYAMSKGPFAPIRSLQRALRFRGPSSTTASSRIGSMLIRPMIRGALPMTALVANRRRYLSRLAWAGPAMREAAYAVARGPRSPMLLRTPRDRYVALATEPMMLGQIETRAQLEVACGLSFAEPWMDDAFVQFIARVPPWTLAYGDRDRGLFRHAMRGHVPDSVRLRPDKADIEPALDRMLVSADERARINALGRGIELSRRGIVDGGRFARATMRVVTQDPDEKACEQEGATWTALWPAIAVEALLQRDRRS